MLKIKDPKWIYFFFITLAEFMFGWMSMIVTPGLHRIGITTSELSLLEAILWITVVLLEIPSGVYADRVSRVHVIRFASTMLCMGGIAYASARDFPGVLVGEIFIALGIASGGNALKSWIIDAHEEELDEKGLDDLFGTEQVIRAITALSAGLLGITYGGGSQYTIWLPMIICSGIHVLISSLFMQEWEKKEKKEPQRHTFKKSWQTIKSNHALTWIAYFGIVAGIIIPYYNYWSLFFEETAGEKKFSSIWVISFMPMVIGGILVKKYGQGKMKESHLLLIVLLCMNLGMFFLSQTTHLTATVMSVMLLQGARGVLMPTVTTYINGRTEEETRTTTNALISTIGKVSLILVPFTIYRYTDGLTTSADLIQKIWFFASVAMFTGIALLWLFRPKK